MKTRVSLLALLFALSPSLAISQSQPAPQPITAVVVKAGKLLDVRKGAYIEGAAIWIEGDRIKEVGTLAEVQSHAPKNAQLIDLSHATVLPGLIDCHTHLMARFADDMPNDYILGLATKSQAFRALEGAADARVTLLAGFTTVRDVENEGSGYADVALRDAIVQALVEGPRMEVATRGIAAVGQYNPFGVSPDLTDFPTGAQMVSGVEDARRAVREQIGHGADLIKVYADWSHPTLTVEEMRVIVEEAHKQGLPIVGHVPDKVRIREVVEAGQKSIEHLMGIFEGCSTEEDRFIKGEGSLKLLLTTQDRQRCDSLIKLLAQNQTWQVPTLAWQRGGTFLDQRDLKHDPLDKYVPAYWRDVTWRRFSDEMMPDLLRDPLTLRQEYFAENLQMVGAMHRAGVPFMAGTDTAPGIYIMPGFSLHDELANFVEAGFTPMESLQTATSNPARFLGMEANLGSVEIGKVADMVLLSANPLEDIRNTRKISMVIANGQFLDRAALNQLLMHVVEAAKRQQ